MITGKQKIGNKEANSGFILSCIMCGRKTNVTLNAHRSEGEENGITGFIVVCNTCTVPEFLHLSTEAKP